MSVWPGDGRSDGARIAVVQNTEDAMFPCIPLIAIREIEMGYGLERNWTIASAYCQGGENTGR